MRMEMNECREIKQELAGVQENVSLKEYTTFNIGGSARCFLQAKTKEDIQEGVKKAKELNLPIFLLGDGSNLLVSDKGFNGFVIYIQNTNYEIRDTELYAEAGVEFPTIVKETIEQGLAGLEWAGGLPGTVGGAVRGNAGAFGGEVKDSIKEVEAIDSSGNLKTFTREECEFAYRSSIFKKEDWIVLSTTFQLKQGDKETIQAVAKDHIKYRKERHPLEYPNAGSIFKNCDLKLFSEEMQHQFEKEDIIKVDPFPVVPTAYLIAQAQLQGLQVGDAQVSEKHPNYMVNRGSATAKDVLELIEKVKKAIKEKFSIDLEVEVQYVE